MNTKSKTMFAIVSVCLMAGCTAPEIANSEVAPAPVAAPASAPEVPPALTEAPAESEPAAAPAIDLATLAIKVDPVCKMSLEEYPATATAEHGGKTYGFCSEFCKKKFVEDPEKMLARLETPAPEGAAAE